MKPQSLSDNRLKERLERLVRHERKIMAVVIEHIAEVMRRKLYLSWGFDNIYKYLRELGYSENCAYHRKWAAEALLEVPEIKAGLEQGSLNLSKVCLVQKVLRQEENVSLEQRREIFNEISGKTIKESEKILDAKVLAPLPKQAAFERHRRDDSVELSLHIPKDLYCKLQKVKELYSHIEPGADWVRILDLMADDVIKKRDPLTKSTRSFLKSKKPSGKKRKPIPTETKRIVLKRDEGRCQYVAPDRRKCESRHQIELDHIIPIHRGGGNEPENLRVYCRAHNAFRFETGL